MSGVGANVLFVTKQIGGVDIPTYNYQASGGSTLSLTFVTDFGVPTTAFGLPLDRSHCIMGIYSINPEINWSNGTGTSFEVSLSAQNIIGLNFN
jgi:hypothetical protein